MVKTFLIGLLLGIAAAAGALYKLPVVDQHREISHVSVAPNGGNRESFHINIPTDRILGGGVDSASRQPAGLTWPDGDVMAAVSTEMFKIRNERDVVIGVAARSVAREADVSIIDWVMHIPARGTMFFNMDAIPHEAGHRSGNLLTGTREFAPFSGVVTERWVADQSGEEDAPDGRIELQAFYVGQLEPAE